MGAGRAGRQAVTTGVAGSVGVIGLGRMGAPICTRLVEQGFEVVATDADPARLSAVPAPAAAVRDVAAVAGRAEVVVTVLPGPGEVADVSGALIAAMATGSIWMDCSTASPAVAGPIAAAACDRGVRVVDAPLGGSPPSARDGRLLSFAGGAAADVERVRPVLAAFADRIVHVGPHGSGYTVKLLANSLWFGQAVAVAEALVVARRAGLDVELVRRALGESAAASRFLSEDAPALLEGDDMTWFALARCAEQLHSLAAFADELSVPAEVLRTVADVHDAALERYGDVDGELLGARFAAERGGGFGPPGSGSPLGG
jgi:3-hydroxyisobutyrate dehydrogenase-like beta-hydroxyacid dehydrogenase